MALPTTSTDNVRIGSTGFVLYAATGTTLPTTATAVPAAGFLANDVGYLSDAGITMSIGRETTDIKAWQNGDTVATIQTGHTVTLALEMLETNSDSLELYFGNFSSSSVEVDGTAPSQKAMIFHVEDSGNDIRIVVPIAKVTETGDVTFANADAVKWPITVTAYPDGNGNKAYIYFASEAS
jgi:hypothetical protein